MSLTVQHPLGLLALAALPVVWWLHHFVLRGPEVPVSCLRLWVEDDRPEHEGRARRRPPLGWVLLLELLGALAFALAVADVRIAPRRLERPHLGVVVDRSASMAGVADGESAWEAVRRLLPALGGGDLRVTLVGSGPEPARMGGPALTLAEADRVLAAEAPGLARHPLEPAVELLQRLGVPREGLLVFSDRDLPLEGLVRVGRPADNTGIVNATWELGLPPTVTLRHFGAGPRPDALVMEAAGAPARSLDVPWDARGGAVLRPEVPAGADSVTFRLPGDALALDDRVTLLRPTGRRPRGRIDHEHPLVRRAFARALAAAGAELTTGEAAELVVTGRTGEAGSASVLRVVVPADARPVAEPILVADRGSPLVQGIDVQGLVWAGRRGVEAGHPLLVAGTTPLVWQEGSDLALQVDPARSNLLQHPAFALLVANWVQEVTRGQEGLRRNYRVGERLRLGHRPDCGREVRLRAPSGREETIAAVGAAFESGPLDEIGVYRVSCGGREETVAVNLLDAAEGDLTGRRPDASLPSVRRRGAELATGGGLLQALLLLAGVLAVAGAWLLLSLSSRPSAGGRGSGGAAAPARRSP